MSILGRKWNGLDRINATLALFILAALIAYLGVTVVSSIDGEHQAINTARTIATNAHNRITDLQRQIRQLERSGRQRTRQIGHLETEQQVLVRQLRKHRIVPAGTVQRITKVNRQPAARPRRHVRHRTPAPHLTPTSTPTCTGLIVAGRCVPLSRSYPGNGKHLGQKKHHKR